MQEESKISQMVEPYGKDFQCFTMKKSAIVGIHLHERIKPQPLYFYFAVKGSDSFITNDKTKQRLEECLATVVSELRPLLIEKLAFNVACEAFNRLPHLSYLELKVIKPSAMKTARAPYAGIRMRRKIYERE